jgi:UDP-3-O-[3-hydroxymyristoyl] glucosamine N-acyltransferase
VGVYLGLQPPTTKKVVSVFVCVFRAPFIGSFSYVGNNVILGDNVNIPQLFYGDNVAVGDNALLFAGAKIYSETIIGNNCTIHSIIGSDGFGFAPNPDGTYTKIPQMGM